VTDDSRTGSSFNPLNPTDSIASAIDALRRRKHDFGDINVNLDCPVFSGYNNIDEASFGVGGIGLGRKQVTTIGSTDGLGRALALNFFADVSLNQGFPVLYFSLSVSKLQLASQLVKLIAYKEKGESGDEASIEKAMVTLASSQTFVIDTPALDIDQILEKTRDLTHMYGRLGLVVIDAIENVHPHWKGTHETGAFKPRMSNLRLLAQTFDVPVILLAKLKSPSSRRIDKRPRITDLTASEIYFGSDKLWSIFRQGLFDASCTFGNLVEIIVEKGRGLPDEPFILAYECHSKAFAECGQIPSIAAVEINLKHRQRRLRHIAHSSVVPPGSSKLQLIR
jgi:replicative DNA helicase